MNAEWIEMRTDYNERKRKDANGKRVMLYVHGGAYFFGSVDEHRYQMQRHARKLKARVLAPRYRLAPQFPFPCGLLDCLATYLYLLTVQDPTEIILAGDSAGGGMVVSMLCLLRDCGLPLPAGAVLISPWVDLTHSFPSVAGGNEYDYIPAHGFMQKPSAAWPPPNEDDMEAIRKGATSKTGNRSERLEAAKGFAVQDSIPTTTEAIANKLDALADHNDPDRNTKRIASAPNHQLSIEIDSKLIVLKDQIQMYTTNQLLSHPLVSPVMQPSLGGLPPLLILTGGGEILRDEQIYLAHKAANPAKYPLGDLYRAKLDPNDTILKRYKPTHVQLQVWDDLCHVAPTLSFTRPAKYMYRSVAQFGAWALARAQHTSIEIQDDDDISFIESESDTQNGSAESTDSLAKSKRLDNYTTGKVGRAGEPLPAFRNFMIRQRVDRHGDIYPLAAPHDLPALVMNPNEVGIIKLGPVRKWIAAKEKWDSKYASTKRGVQKQRIKELVGGGPVLFAFGETPPPSALAARRTANDMHEKKKKMGYGLAMWSMWGSEHDKIAVKNEEKAVEEDGKDNRAPIFSSAKGEDDRNRKKSQSRTRKRSSSMKHQGDVGRSRSRRRTITVRDQGQAGEHEPVSHDDTSCSIPAAQTQLSTASATRESAHVRPMFLPKFKAAFHLHNESRDHSDDASTKTGISQISHVSPDDASTTAVFSAAGVSRKRNITNASSLITNEVPDEHDAIDSEVASTTRPGYDTPGSSRSVERLQDHQLEIPSDGRLQPVRTPSSQAVHGVAGVVRVVEDVPTGNGMERSQTDNAVVNGRNPENIPLERPGMYDRKDTRFETAAEKL